MRVAQSYYGFEDGKDCPFDAFKARAMAGYTKMREHDDYKQLEKQFLEKSVSLLDGARLQSKIEEKWISPDFRRDFIIGMLQVRYRQQGNCALAKLPILDILQKIEN